MKSAQIMPILLTKMKIPPTIPLLITHPPVISPKFAITSLIHDRPAIANHQKVFEMNKLRLLENRVCYLSPIQTLLIPLRICRSDIVILL